MHANRVGRTAPQISVLDVREIFAKNVPASLRSWISRSKRRSRTFGCADVVFMGLVETTMFI
jgi:hypothetical protein